MANSFWSIAPPVGNPPAAHKLRNRGDRRETKQKPGTGDRGLLPDGNACDGGRAHPCRPETEPFRRIRDRLPHGETSRKTWLCERARFRGRAQEVREQSRGAP